MGPLTRLAIFWILILALLPCLPGRTTAQSNSATPPHTLFSQSAIRVLEREFSDNSVSYLLLEANSGVLLASRWENSGKPIPLGSLVKPFTALAYAGAHDFRYPIYECRGQASGCWQVRPHGKLDIVSAISVSCNSYFRSLAESVTSEQLLPVTSTFDLESPEANFTGPSLIGIGERWKISPVRMVRAYLELFRRRDQPGVREILAGMLQSAQRGTGAAVGRRLKHSEAYVKTGTAPCTHARHSPGDGFVVALVPAQAPEIVLMVRVHGVPGAKAAETAGRMLSRMEE
jgi:cell division protein FtsI/penicillin-binding protein 2